MRLWHKDLIPYLPRKQLLGQWRECCAIAKSISEKGTPGHILVNKIMEYPMEDFFTYGMAVCAEMKKRGYGPTQNAIADFTKHILDHDEKGAQYIDLEEVFFLWHTHRYFMQCFYNLEEKYDCGGITQEEWNKILFLYKGGSNVQKSF